MKEHMPIPDSIKKWLGEPTKIDYNDTKQLVEDLWLFLTSDKMPAKANIKKEAFAHEVGVIIDTVRMYAVHSGLNMTFKTLLLKNEAGINRFARFGFSPGSASIYYHHTPEVIPADWTMDYIRKVFKQMNAPDEEMQKLDNCELVEVEVIIKMPSKVKGGDD